MSDSNVREVEVREVPVELYKILKFEGLVGSGAEAKAAVAAGLVQLNGVVETRKRKKVVAGDVVSFASETLHITHKGGLTEGAL